MSSDSEPCTTDGAVRAVNSVGCVRAAAEATTVHTGNSVVMAVDTLVSAVVPSVDGEVGGEGGDGGEDGDGDDAEIVGIIKRWARRRGKIRWVCTGNAVTT